MTLIERVKFEINSRYLRFKYRNNYSKVKEWNRKRIDSLVNDIVVEGNPYRIWGEIIPAVYLTEWEVRYIAGCSSEDSENIKRWLDEKLEDIHQDMI